MTGLNSTQAIQVAATQGTEVEEEVRVRVKVAGIACRDGKVGVGDDKYW